jgi:hypothetical protein
MKETVSYNLMPYSCVELTLRQAIGDWGEAIAVFVKMQMHFSSRRLVIIGHSAGCSATSVNR